MNIAIIGTGLIGAKRASALPNGIRLFAVCDVNKNKADKFASEFKCISEHDWKKIIKNAKIHAIIISTPNKYLSPIAEAAILEGKHVLIEKPGAKNINDVKKIIKAHQKRKVVVQIGYNHRFHPAIIKAKEIIESNKYGPILFIRARYGHGGRLGYEKEWRFQKEVSGGGELIDQGCHLIDLVNFFCGEMNDSSGYVTNFFWKTNLEDAAFFHLKNEKNQIADISVTCVEWKNIFSFEIMLKTAKIQIDGLGRSYGKEKLMLFVMSKKMGPPKVKEFNFPEDDLSWKKENQFFIKKINSHDYSNNSLKDAFYVLNMINKIYKQNKI